MMTWIPDWTVLPLEIVANLLRKCHLNLTVVHWGSVSEFFLGSQARAEIPSPRWWGSIGLLMVPTRPRLSFNKSAAGEFKFVNEP